MEVAVSSATLGFRLIRAFDGKHLDRCYSTQSAGSLETALKFHLRSFHTISELFNRHVLSRMHAVDESARRRTGYTPAELGNESCTGKSACLGVETRRFG